MWMGLPTQRIIFFFAVFLSSGITTLSVGAQKVPRVFEVTPNEGSSNGGTRITLRGQNFAKTLFTLGNDADEIGNKVTLVSLEPYGCDIHPDGTHQTQITCYTTPMPEGTYAIKVSVDGVDVPDSQICSGCTFEVRRPNTPTITSVVPPSGLPGQVIKLSGNLCTDKYGSNIPDETLAQILRVYFGGQKCELRKSIDDMYGLEYSDGKGYMMCKTEGTFIGNHYISYIVSNEYGRSAEDGFTKYPRSNGISMYQTFAEITGISLSQGSKAGGTKITITGKYFDETTTDVKVEIAGAECAISDKVSDTAIVCTTPPANSSQMTKHFTGGRGFRAYVQSGIVDAHTIDKRVTPMELLASSEWRGYNRSEHTVLITGFFLPTTTNDYSFCINASSEAKLFISTDGDPTNKRLISESNNSCEGPYPLAKDQRCYIEVHYSSDKLDSYVTLVGHMKETNYTESDTAWADHELQNLTIEAESKPEIQEITVHSDGTQGLKPDVQKIVIKGEGSSTFVIGLDGVYTNLLSLAKLTGKMLQSELKELPSVVGDVMVKVEGSETDKVVTITSKFKHGIVGDYKGMSIDELGSLTFSYTRLAYGSRASNYFALSMESIWTVPIEIRSSEKQVKSALERLFSVQCHPKLEEGIVDGFELKRGWMSQIVSDTEPFCGRYSIKNPYHLLLVTRDYPRLSASGNRYICFAYKGPGGLAAFKVSYINIDYDSNSKYYFKTVSYTNPNENLEEWNYRCEDLYARLREVTPGMLQTVRRISAVKKIRSQDLFMDQFSVRKSIPFTKDLFAKISMWRKPQAQPKGYFIDRVDVTQIKNGYRIQMKPHNCLDHFDMLGISPGVVKRLQRASSPISGTFRISFKDDTTDKIPVTDTADPTGVAAFLAATKMGFSEVTGSGMCSRQVYEIKMLSQTGDQPDIRIDSSQLKGDGVAATVEVMRNGGLWLSPIMDDMLRTYHGDTPQVIAYINGIPTRCAIGTFCDFAWSEYATPIVSSISPQSGSKGTSASISGSGFGSNNEVTFGDTPCSVTSSNPTSVVCTVGNGPTGPAPVKVYVEDKGMALGDVTFTFNTAVNNFPSSITGSLAGGKVLAFSGIGFTSDAEVKVDGNICTILSISDSDVECITPRAASLSSTVVDVVMTQAGSEIRIGSFTYSLSDTPIIASTNVSSSPVSGGGVIAIAGSDFGSDDMPVMVEDVHMKVISYTDTKIIAVLPAMPHGSYKIIVNVDGKGYADLRTNSISDIQYTFIVTSMYPNFGSVFGGTDLTINGAGFQESFLEVHVGHHECKLTSVQYSNIHCRIKATGTHHHIFANGTHKTYGAGYAWDKDPYTVSVGDTVTWHWETPFYVKDITYSVRQTAKVSDLVDMPGGISSGENTRKGSFSHTFAVAGTYHFWTNYMDPSRVIYFRGMLHVAPLESSSQTLSVKMLGNEASYQTSSSSKSPTYSCPEKTSRVPGCADTAVLQTEASKFNFKFSKCFSPFIDVQSLKSGSFYDVIYLRGKGFGTKNCQNVISYGKEQEFEKGCTQVVQSSTSSIDFKILPSCEPPVGELHSFKLHVHNLGYALMSQPPSSSDFGLLPIVEGIKPSSGSKTGGTKVTISGAGFTGAVENVLVKFELLSCEIESMTYTSIICIIKCASAPSSCPVGHLSFSVTVGNVMASCSVSVCSFTTSEAKTPKITKVTPNSVSSAPVQLQFIGSRFSSDLTVFIGGVECIVSGGVSSTRFTCKVGRLPVGLNDVSAYFAPEGKAATDEVVASEKIAAIRSPRESSVRGGATMFITGNGFVDGDTDVKVNRADCMDKVVTLSQVKCTLPPQSSGTHDVVIISNGQIYDKLFLKYTSQSTPVVQKISPNSGAQGDKLVIDGLGFYSPAQSSPQVKIGGVECQVTSLVDTSITCTAGIQSTGLFPVQVFVTDKGLSDGNVMFTYQLSPFTVSPNAGSPNGGQVVTLSGSGFLANETDVTICGEVCEEILATSAQFVCKTAPNKVGSCDVVAEVNGARHTESLGYKYDANLVSSVTGVSPSRGGTGGGTVITISGTNFGVIKTDIQVLIEGTECVIQTVTDTKITCKTGPSKKSILTEVEVQRNGQGLAEQKNAAFEYIDVWSSIYTWGGQHVPADGEFIIIPKGQKILLDVDSSVLAMLLIRGGHLVFDEANIELQSQRVLITDGGILEIGTEKKPFQHKAIISLHGHVRSKELPVYGAKGIGVREGMLELHGKYIAVPWTYLSVTATAGTSTIDLTHAVNWSVGDDVVIATTGDRLSQKESEVREIASISANKKQLTLTKPLKYEHISETGNIGSRRVEFRAEVGLLTRNVLVRGHRNVEFDHTVKACPDGFNPGEFSTQTCFQGRFGEEVGSDQYGVHILIHQQNKDTQVAQAHIENVEVTHAGQAFRLGRYPIHFHLNGNMSQSYVRRCAIHHTFNRAVNIHGSHHIMIEHNVVYDAMGGALFLEDGNEMGNTFQYNLEILIKSSTSLINDDITPAAIWATNPYNFIRHNAAAGGTHFGVWYRMHKHPDGPGFTDTICPQNIPLGEYSNNTAHSLGWFGLWIFEAYVPRDSYVCSSTAPHKVAKFYSLTAWNNNEGAEVVTAGAIQFRDFVIVNNQKSGIHFSLITGKPPQYDADKGPGVFNSIVVAHYKNLKGASTRQGIVQPYFNGFFVKDVEFHNFDQDRSVVFAWVHIAGTCHLFCGGFSTSVSGLKFVNSPNKVKFAWENEGFIRDLDGSLTGNVGSSAVACSGSLSPSKCSKNNEFSAGVDGCVCKKDIKLIRFSFNNILPESLIYKRALFTNKHGTTKAEYADKRVSFKKGWQVVLKANETYEFLFENAEQAVNISYDGTVYGLTGGDYLILTQRADKIPDVFQLDGRTDLTVSSSIPAGGGGISHGDWFYGANTITYAIKNNIGDEKDIAMRAISCYFRGCKRPDSALSTMTEPENGEPTSNPQTWKNMTIHGKPPEPMDDLYVARDRWIIVDTVLPKLGKVIIEGGLQFADDFLQDNLLEADYIYAKGRLVAGWSEEKTFNGKLTIRLRGDHSSPSYPTSDGPNLGSKFIAVFGGLQLHGTKRKIIKTVLASDAKRGDSIIKVKDSVDWRVGEDILISTTDYDAWHTEIFKIKKVSGKSLSIVGSIQHRHISHQETVNGKVLELSARVVLLSRNIRVEGAKYDNIMTESFGARIIVGQTINNDYMFSGFAQVSNVEFVRCGQEGFTSRYDPRFALTYQGVSSTKGKLRYSYVKQNAFHDGFSPAIGVFGTDDLEIEDNVIHHTVGPGIRIETAGAKVRNNLITLSIWPGTYLDRKEKENLDYSGGIQAYKATNMTLVGNTVAGSERMAFGLAGQACSTAPELLWSDNMAVGAQSGVILFLQDTPADEMCTQFSGFIFWKNFDYGIYYNNKPSVVIKNNIFIENSVGVALIVVGPSALKHAYADKSAKIENNVFIGKTSSFSESLDVIPSNANIELSEVAREKFSNSVCGKVGILTATFTSGHNEAPVMHWLGIVQYNAINGITIVKGNHFINYKSCTGGYDHVIATNKCNDDVIHPVTVAKSKLTNVDKNSKIRFHIPNVGKVNPTDCVDMDCDAHKKCVVTDLDGTFLGFRGNILPDAAYEWDGDRRHGLGNFRIPLAMLSTSDGRKRDPDIMAPNKGLYKIDECTWVDAWVAYECNNDLEWRLLVAESMDNDTEKRRLSPIAVYHEDGYVDLVNGPQDHGWCSGYTCQKRLSTFPILVALGQAFNLFLTSSNPRKMRYMLLNSKRSDCVRLSMWYNIINRLEIKVDGHYVLPNNGFYDVKGRFRIKLEETKGQFMPDILKMTVGENYASQQDQIVTWVVCGGVEVIVNRVDALLVSFTLPEMTIDEFFGESLIENLAGFLNIDPKKIRVVDVVTKSNKRKRRSSRSSTVHIEISDTSSDTPSDTSGTPSNIPSNTPSNTPRETRSIDTLKISNKIINLVQFGDISKVLQVEVLYTAIVDSTADTPVVLQKPGMLILHTPPQGNVIENVPFRVQPKLKVTDKKGYVVAKLGSAISAWEVEASIESGGMARASAVGTTRIPFIKGWANYTDLAIDDPGNDYVIQFRIVSPPQATNYTVYSPEIQIVGRPLQPKVKLLKSKHLTETNIELEVRLLDTDTNRFLTDIGWDNLKWSAEIDIYDRVVYSGAMTGKTKADFDPKTARATFSNVRLDKPGTCPLLVTVTSDPMSYALKTVVRVGLITPAQDSMIVTEFHSIQFRFPIAFDDAKTLFWADQVANRYSMMSYFKTTRASVTYQKGCIYITLLIETNLYGYGKAIHRMCTDVVYANEREFYFDGTKVMMDHFLKIDGVPYSPFLCEPIVSSVSNGKQPYFMDVYTIATILITFILLAVVVAAFYMLKFESKSNGILKDRQLSTTGDDGISSKQSFPTNEDKKDTTKFTFKTSASGETSL